MINMKFTISLLGFCAVLYSCSFTEKVERFRAKDANRSFEAEISKYKLEDFKTLTDVGCAELESEKRISFLYPNTKFILVDANPKVIKRAKKLIKINTFNSSYNYEKNCQVISGGADNIPLADNSSELVLCRKSLRNFNDINKMSGELTRILSKNGILIIVEPIINDSKSQQEYFSKENIINLFQKNGLSLISSDTSSYKVEKKGVENFNILRFQKQS